jgi:hypothetical protein
MLRWTGTVKDCPVRLVNCRDGYMCDNFKQNAKLFRWFTNLLY